MAVKYKFTRDFDYQIPGKRSFVAYKKGMEELIPEAHADAADKEQVGQRTGVSDASKTAGGAAQVKG